MNWKATYAIRRQQLLDNREGPCLICIFSGNAPMRSADESYAFSVDRSFYYLTGLDQENMILVLRKSADGGESQLLFAPPYDPYLAKWVGGRMQPEEITAESGIAQVRNRETFYSWLCGALESSRGTGEMQVWLDLWRYTPEQADTPAHILASRLQQRYPAVRIREIFGELADMRTVKDDNELQLMRRAQETTNQAIRDMMAYAKPGMNETEIEGAFDFSLMRQGCREHAFPTICASGPRATTLHYSSNNCVAQDGQLVLVDLGSAQQHYCADISRTFPINGRFTPRQKEIYDTVLEAQRLVIGTARPGVSMRQLNQVVIDYYESRLDDLGLRKGDKTVGDYYYHGVTHSLGLDTHDVTNDLVLKPGMVITAEPGLYIEEEGIGVRIEDDILITQDGAVDLSADIPKTTAQIEAIMNRQ